jgi:hypothetical protein
MEVCFELIRLSVVQAVREKMRRIKNVVAATADQLLMHNIFPLKLLYFGIPREQLFIFFILLSCSFWRFVFFWLFVQFPCA